MGITACKGRDHGHRRLGCVAGLGMGCMQGESRLQSSIPCVVHRLLIAATQLPSAAHEFVPHLAFGDQLSQVVEAVKLLNAEKHKMSRSMSHCSNTLSSPYSLCVQLAYQGRSYIRLDSTHRLADNGNGPPEHPGTPAA